MQVQELFRLQVQIQKKTFKTAVAHPVTTLQSLKQSTSCSYCQIMKNVCDDLQMNIDDLITEYNSLLIISDKITGNMVSIIEQNQHNFISLQKQLEDKCILLEEQEKQYDSIVKNKECLITQLNNVILQKQYYIDEIQKNCVRYYNKENSIEIQNRQLKVTCQNLSRYKRDRSSLYNIIQSQNSRLQHQNNLLQQQNLKLHLQIKQMGEILKNLQENLLDNNITTPRVIIQTKAEESDNSPSQFQSETRQLQGSQQYRDNFKSQNSLDKQSDIVCQSCSGLPEDMQRQNCHLNCRRRINFHQNNSMESSMGNIKSNPLRDVLNISAETNKYFKFTNTNNSRFCSKYIKTGSDHSFNDCDGFVQSAQNLRNKTGQKASIQNYDKTNTVQIINHKPNKYQNDIQQFSIKQKTISEQDSSSIMFSGHIQPKVFHANTQQVCQELPTPTITIDPYYAFFTLTIQCIKLNWKNMDEVANIDLAHQWNYLINTGIQMNLWENHLQQKMKEKVKANIGMTNMINIAARRKSSNFNKKSQK